MSISNVSVVSRATANTIPVSPKLKLLSIVGLALGILIALSWGLVRELTDQTIKDIDFITDDLGLVNLGIVNYVVRMKDMDQAIQQSRATDSGNDVQDDLDGIDFPQRSRRRI